MTVEDVGNLMGCFSDFKIFTTDLYNLKSKIII